MKGLYEAWLRMAEGMNGLRYELGHVEMAEAVEKQLWKFAREQKLKLSAAQFEALLDAAHPRLRKIYWPIAGVLRTLRQQGLSGMVKKIKQHIRKGEAE